MVHKYNTYCVKRNGKRRTIHEPTPETRVIHEDMLELFSEYSSELASTYATGSVRGKSLLHNVLPHQHSSKYYKLDIRDAFPSVDARTLLMIAEEVFKGRLGARGDFEFVKDFILNYGTLPDEKGLPQGAPCSPLLFDLYCLPMDEALGELADQQGLQYTRYFDDLTFSSSEEDGSLGKSSRRKIRDIVESVPGFEVNHRKSQLHSINNGPVSITGLSIYPGKNRVIKPSPAILEKMFQTFNRIEHELNTTFVHDNGWRAAHELLGWNSIIESMWDQSQAMPEILKQAQQEFRRLFERVSVDGKTLQDERRRQISRAALKVEIYVILNY